MPDVSEPIRGWKVDRDGRITSASDMPSIGYLWHPDREAPESEPHLLRPTDLTRAVCGILMPEDGWWYIPGVVGKTFLFCRECTRRVFAETVNGAGA